MEGFPPPAESRVTLDNWQQPPFNRWAFRHMREVIPSQRIRRGDGVPRHLVDTAAPDPLDDLAVERLEGRGTLADVLAETYTDSVIVLHDGRVMLERYYSGMRPDTLHLLMSVSKSVVGCVTGVLVGQGLIDPAEEVSHYVPEIAGSGYDGATVRNLLDMRTGVRFSEEYTDPDAEVRVMERHMGWRPPDEPDERGACTRILTTLGRERSTGARSSTGRRTPTCSAGCASAQRTHGWPT